MIALLRVDNRLLHGQILETWIPRLRVEEVVVADDEAAASDLARAAMTLCVPPNLPVRVVRVDAVGWEGLAAAARPVLVLLREVATLVRASGAGLLPALRAARMSPTRAMRRAPCCTASRKATGTTNCSATCAFHAR